MQQRDHDARTRGANRVTQRTGSAVDVDDIVAQIQVMHQRHGYDRKGFVDLPQVHVLYRPARTRQHLAHRPHGRRGKPVGLLCVHRMRHDTRQRLASQLGGGAFAHQHHGRCPIVDARATACGDGAVFLESGFERGDLVELDAPGAFVDGNQLVTATPAHRYRSDFGGKSSGGRGVLRAAGAGDGKLVLLRAGKAKLGGTVFAKSSHGAARLVGVFQAVEHHVVKNAVMANAVAATALLQQVGRVGHALHATGHHHVCAASNQHIVTKHGRAHARSTHLAQGHRASAVGQAALISRLARRCLPLAGHQAVAKQHLVDQLRRNTGAFNCGPDGDAAKVVCGQRGKVTLKTAHRGAGGANNHNWV